MLHISYQLLEDAMEALMVFPLRLKVGRALPYPSETRQLLLGARCLVFGKDNLDIVVVQQRSPVLKVRRCVLPG